MHDTKPWYASLTVWGAIVSVAASALALFNIHLDAQAQSDLRDLLLAASTLAGGAVALWGRLRASRRIVTPGTVQTAARPRPQDWRMNALIPFAPILLLLPLSQSTGCSALTLPSADYVAADRATYEAVAPEYAQYVHSDASLDDEQRARRSRTIDTWRLRIESATPGRDARD